MNVTGRCYLQEAASTHSSQALALGSFHSSLCALIIHVRVRVCVHTCVCEKLWNNFVIKQTECKSKMTINEIKLMWQLDMYWLKEALDSFPDVQIIIWWSGSSHEFFPIYFKSHQYSSTLYVPQKLPSWSIHILKILDPQNNFRELEPVQNAKKILSEGLPKNCWIRYP